MNNWKVIFATVVIFGTGVITGGLLVNYVQQSAAKNTRPKPAVTAVVHPMATNQATRVVDNAKPKPPEILSKQFLQQLDESLALKVEQREAIQKIINEGQNLMRKVVQDARLEIREVLLPEQLRQFDDLMKRPFRKPLFSTNNPPVSSAAGSDSINDKRLIKMMNGKPLTPEEQVLQLEAQRANLRAAAPLPTPLLSPPLMPPTNAP